MDTGWHPSSRFLELDLDPGAPGAGRPRAPSRRAERVRAHVVDAGPRDAPPERTLVLVHGIGVSSWAWRKNIDALTRDDLPGGAFRVIAPCQKGHGWSGRTAGGYALPELAAFVWHILDALGVARATFVGNSLGGAVSLFTAIHAPARVARLVLVNPAAHADQRPWGLLKTQIAALAPVYRALVGPTLFRIPLRLLAYRGIPVDREYMAGFWAPFEAPGSMRALVAVARGLPQGIADLEARLHEVRQPTLVVWGQDDAVLPVGGAYRLLRHMPHARLVLFPGVGHCPQEEAAERFNGLVRAFHER